MLVFPCYSAEPPCSSLEVCLTMLQSGGLHQKHTGLCTAEYKLCGNILRGLIFSVFRIFKKIFAHYLETQCSGVIGYSLWRKQGLNE